MTMPVHRDRRHRHDRPWRDLVVGGWLAVSTLTCAAQGASRSSPLLDELARMDRERFDAAFVACDAVRFKALFTEDAEFPHDRTGLSSGEGARTMKSCPRDGGVTRTLVPGSREVHPLRGHGAIQMGRHVFARRGEPGSETATFVHPWTREGGRRRLARVLSFDHRPSPPAP